MGDENKRDVGTAAYTLSEDDEQRTRDLLVGRRIVKAERGRDYLLHAGPMLRSIKCEGFAS